MSKIASVMPSGSNSSAGRSAIRLYEPLRRLPAKPNNDSGFSYMTDSGIYCDPLHGGLIVYDMKANAARRGLDRTMFTNDEPGFFFNIDGGPVLKNAPCEPVPMALPCQATGELFIGQISPITVLYAIETALLRDPRVSETDLQYAVRVATLLPHEDTPGLGSGVQRPGSGDGRPDHRRCRADHPGQ